MLGPGDIGIKLVIVLILSSYVKVTNKQTTKIQCVNIIIVIRARDGIQDGLTYPTRMERKLGKTSLRT